MAVGRFGGFRLAMFMLFMFMAMASACGFSEPDLSPITPVTPQTVAIPPVAHKTGIFDVMAVDQPGHRLYVADGLDRGIDVVDIGHVPGRYVTTIPLHEIVNGLVYVPAQRQLLVAIDDSTVAAIDVGAGTGRPYRMLWRTATGGEGAADLLGYDPSHHKVYVTNPDDGYVTSISTTSHRVVRQIRNLGFTGQPVINPVDGMVYVPNSDRNSIYKISPATDSVVAEYALGVICEPHGMAIDAATDQALIGCQNKDKEGQLSISWDFRRERIMRTFAFAGAGDAVIFDPVAGHFYFAAHNYTPPEIAVFSANPLTFLTAIPTSAKSHGVAYDEAHRLIYTYDGRHGEAAIWSFRDPVAGCVGRQAALAARGAQRTLTPACEPDRDARERHRSTQ